ncbi:MAG: AIR synthase related protein [Candidatus Pacearchaeota archaeon]|jgi:phosphoribosylaminoimidazole (AIR) synthetase
MAEQYLLDIKEKDDMSRLLCELASQTHSYDFFGHRTSFDHVVNVVPGKNGINALKVPGNSLCIVYSVGGDKGEMDLRKYSESVVENVFNSGRRIGARVMGMADIIDASHTDEGLVRTVGEGLRDRAILRGVPILNGELANLGRRVNCDCNITGTGIGFISKDSPFVNKVPSAFEYEGVWYAVFDPKGKLVVINSDGIGTKTEFYERFEKYSQGVIDFFAMNLDDCVKMGATPQVISGLIEYNGSVPVEEIINRARHEASQMQIVSIMQDENLKNRIKGHFSSYNISGSVVSTIDARRLANLPYPKAGDSLIAIRGKPNPRSNGITAKRQVMEKLFGKDWHYTEAGKVFGEYLSEPSTVFYPVFKKLIDSGLASSVYHMSGGAYDGKLSKPLAKHGLSCEVGMSEETRLFEPDWREVLMAAYSSSVRDSYAKWPMGNEGFVTSSLPDSAIAMIKEDNLEAKVVGILEKKKDTYGVVLQAFNGEIVDFTRRAA